MPFEIISDLGLAVDFSLAVFLWVVQCIIYPSFRHLREAVFQNWHRAYQRRISLIIGPILLMQMFLVCFEAFFSPSAYSLIRLCLIAACWLITACVSVPLHQKIERGVAREQSIERLIESNWLRTVLWTGLFLSHLLK